MNIPYKVIDNVFDASLFSERYGVIVDAESQLSYSYTDKVADDGDNSGFYFVHKLYDKHYIFSEFFEPLVYPICEFVDAAVVVQAKINLFTRQEKNVLYGRHVDLHFPHYTCILYINTCNGGTLLGDNDEVFVGSVANRLLIFNGTVPHRSVGCTDENVRLNINVNYIPRRKEDWDE